MAQIAAIAVYIQTCAFIIAVNAPSKMEARLP
jgi:hypothetical protein